MSLMEDMLATKFEKIQEIKMTYDFMIRKLNKEKHAEKIKELKTKQAVLIEETKVSMDQDRAHSVEELKTKVEAQKKEV